MQLQLVCPQPLLALHACRPTRACPPPAQATLTLLKLARALLLAPPGCHPQHTSRPIRHVAAYVDVCMEAAAVFTGLAFTDDMRVGLQQPPAAAAARGGLTADQQAALRTVLPRAPEAPQALWPDGRLWLLLVAMAAGFVHEPAAASSLRGGDPDLALNLWAAARRQLLNSPRRTDYEAQLRRLADAQVGRILGACAGLSCPPAPG